MEKRLVLSSIQINLIGSIIKNELKNNNEEAKKLKLIKDEKGIIYLAINSKIDILYFGKIMYYLGLEVQKDVSNW